MKRALRLLISNFPRIGQDGPGCRFNIVDFGSTTSRLFVDSVSPTEKNLQKAWEHVNQIKANLGGTDLHVALKYLYLIGFEDKRPRNLFVSFLYFIFFNLGV